MNTLDQTAPAPKTSAFANPLIKKLGRVTEQSPDHAVSYHGVAAKTLFFMIAVAVGVASFFIFHKVLAVGGAMEADGFTIYPFEGAFALVALFVSGFAPFLAFLIRPLVPVLGLIYCLSIGYAITWLAATVIPTYSGIVFLALGITIVLVAVMAFLYASGAIKVGKRFRAVVITLFITAALSGVIGFVLSFIPGLHDTMQYVTSNPIVSLIGGVLYIILACAMLLVDFDAIQRAVDNQLPKKYEWIAAFGLAYTIIYLFLKVFSLLASVKGNSSSSKS